MLLPTVETDERNKPTQEIRMTVRVLRLAKSEIEERFNHTYPK